MSKKVIAAFKGKVIVSNSPLEMQGDDKSTIAKIKKDTLTAVIGAPGGDDVYAWRSEEHTSELQSHVNLVCRLLLEKKKKKITHYHENTLYMILNLPKIRTIPNEYYKVHLYMNLHHHFCFLCALLYSVTLTYATFLL